MGNTSKFQVVVLGLFIFFTIAGLLIFALYKGGSTKEALPVIVWGTLDRNTAGVFMEVAAQRQDLDVSYVQKAPETFERELLEAIAIDAGPDAILLPQDSILKYRNKLIVVPYTTLPEVTFKNTFIQEGELYMFPEGIYGVPFAIDPMVMYWNRDILTDADIAQPPKTWEEFLVLPSLITKRDAAYNITQSAVALGEFRNVTHAKDILSLLLLQAGDPIIAKTTSGFSAVFGQSQSGVQNPASSALVFYTQFADPVKRVYSWNRALPDSKSLFIANRLGIYFGYASEIAEIRQKNPNLNFDVAMMPQPKAKFDRDIKTTFGRMYAFAIVRGTPDPANAYETISFLTSNNILREWNAVSGLPSVRRDSLTFNPANAASAMFVSSALNAQGWLDPNPEGTSAIFRQMIEDVTSGRSLVEEAIQITRGQLGSLLPQ